jgi:hypothetical protein
LIQLLQPHDGSSVNIVTESSADNTIRISDLVGDLSLGVLSMAFVVREAAI